MKELAFAKINLILDIKGKRMDGYHELKSLMIPIDLYDTLTFGKDNEIKLTSNIDISDNAILKVSYHMKERFKVKTGVHIHLDKVIPIGAGLAGGSADISATIRGLNQFWGLNLKQKELEELANLFGSDTLFTLYNKPAIITGRGDFIEFVDEMEKIDNILLIVPNFSMLTKDVFKSFGKDKPNDFDGAYLKCKNKDYSFIYNDLLHAAILSSSAFKSLYLNLKKDELDVHLSGSGSTLFVINPKDVDVLKLRSYKEIQMIHTKQV